MCEGELNGGLIELGQELEPRLIVVSIGDEIVMIDLSGYTEDEIEEIEDLWGEGIHGTLQQDMTYKGIPFESKPFCLKRWAKEE